MYQGYISAEKIWFARHEGKYEGAEGLRAFSSALEANPPATQLKAVCIDYSDVTSATLDDTDRANTTFFVGQFARYKQQVDSLLVVRVFNPKNVAINKILRERDARMAGPFVDLGTIVEVYSVPEAIEALGLSADYCIEYPAKQ
tara:strand:+ start:196 stop:627 length:432 start_codon:yes stop_codon:yes gene_type:complete